MLTQESGFFSWETSSQIFQGDRIQVGNLLLKKFREKKTVLCSILSMIFESLGLFQNIKRGGKADSVTTI